MWTGHATLLIGRQGYLVNRTCPPLIERNNSNYIYRSFKGTVSVILSYPPCKVGNARLTKIPLKALSNQVWIRFLFLWNVYFHLRFLCESDLRHFYQIHEIKCTVVNRALSFLHWGSHGLTVTIPLGWHSFYLKILIWSLTYGINK